MLNAMRKGAKSWPGWIVAALVIAGLSAFGIDAFFAQTPMSNQVAKVGETEINGASFATALQTQQNRLIRERQAAVSIQDMRDEGIADDVLAGLIRDAAMTEELHRLGMAVSQEDIAADIRTNPSFQDDQGQFSQFLFQQRLVANGFDPQAFPDITRRLLEQRILAAGIARPVGNLPGAGARIAAFRGEQREVSTILMPVASADDPGEPAGPILSGWFEENIETFREPDRRWGRYLHIDLVAMIGENTPTDEQIAAEYEANKARYSVPASRQVEQIIYPDRAAAEAALARLAEGDVTFADLATEAGVAEGDLSLGAIGDGDLPPAMNGPVFAAEDIGPIGPIDTGGGFALFNIVQITEGGPAPLEDIKPALSAMMAQRAAQDKAPLIANQIDDLRAEGLTLEEIAEKTGLTVKTFEGLSPTGQLADLSPAGGLMRQPQFIAEVFEALDGEERDQVQAQDGSYFLVEVDKIVPTHLPKLDAIRDRVVTAWQLEQRLSQLEANGAAMIAKLGETDLASQAEAAEYDIAARPAFSRLQPSPDFTADLLEAAFTAPEGGGFVGRNRANSGVLVGVVRKVIPLADDDMATQTEELSGYLAQGAARDTMEYFARAVEARHQAEPFPTNIDGVYEYLGGQAGGGG